MKKKSARSLSYHFTTVTTLSKTIAFILFITLPILAFFIGVKYGEVRGMTDDQDTQVNTYLQQIPPSPSVVPHREF